MQHRHAMQALFSPCLQDMEMKGALMGYQPVVWVRGEYMSGLASLPRCVNRKRLTCEMRFICSWNFSCEMLGDLGLVECA